jgi:D-glycero-D-manno-heptose 1,7-bisphosphate phosphatase
MVKKINHPKGTVLLLLDRDGVLSVNRYPAPRNTSEFKLVPNIVKIFGQIKGKNFKIGIITNQKYVASGELKRKDLEKMHLLLRQKFIKAGLISKDIKIKVCPHADDAGCKCRKPNIGLIEQIVGAFSIDPTNTRFYLVGDKPLDIETLLNYYKIVLKPLGIERKNVRTILLKWRFGENRSKYFKNSTVPDYTAHSLEDSIRFIVDSEKEGK